MILRYSMIVAAGVLLSACQSAHQIGADAQPGEREYAEMIRDTKPPAGPAHQVAAGVLSPREAISHAAQSAPDGYPGTFGMQVRNIGSDTRGTLYLNSELNYREQTNISVRLSREMGRELALLHGENWIREVVGRNIEVDGEAKREVIWFNDSRLGRTKSYYYQTQIHVTSADQIRLL